MQAKLDTVKKHMTGKRFNAAKGKLWVRTTWGAAFDTATDFVNGRAAEFEKDERELMEEPDIETSEEVSCSQCMSACLLFCN